MNVFAKACRFARARLLNDIYERLERSEYHSFNRRFYAVEQITEYLIGAQIPGDYFEFGIYQGTTFAYACNFMSPHFSSMRFIACDSFAGLPAPKGIDAVDGYSSRFFERQFQCSKEQVLANLRRKGVDLNRVITVEGWFDKTLTHETRETRNLEKVALAWIDCDLYESTVPVLEFITPMLSLGSVVLFDDWRCFRNLPEYGQQRAVREWLTKYPNVRLAELLSFGWNGLAFTVSGL
jgi:O-methyltransferase